MFCYCLFLVVFCFDCMWLCLFVLSFRVCSFVFMVVCWVVSAFGLVVCVVCVVCFVGFVGGVCFWFVLCCFVLLRGVLIYVA